VVACVVGVGVVLTGVVGHHVDAPDIAIGVLIFAVGVRLALRGLPGSRLSERGRLRATAQGIVIPGTSERTVAWKKFERLQVQRHGTKLDVFIKLTSGKLEPVPSLARRDLYTRGAHARATAALRALEAELQAERERQLS
jgi:hypothetical protein